MVGRGNLNKAFILLIYDVFFDLFFCWNTDWNTMLQSVSLQVPSRLVRIRQKP